MKPSLWSGLGLVVVVLGLFWAGNRLTQRDQVVAPEVIKEPGDTVVFKIYQGGEICQAVDQEITALENKPYAVENAANLRFWKVQLRDGVKVNFITQSEDPFVVGHRFMLGTKCQALTAEETKRYQAELKECYRVYRWDQSVQEIKTECGFMVENRVIYLPKKTN